MQAFALAIAMGMASAFKTVFVNVQKDTLALTAPLVRLYLFKEFSFLVFVVCFFTFSVHACL